ncbi:MAG TPA: hypothetical protein VG929_12270 [Actinomycetota bacterium]|nr:hypothetical protein [Actinomycetota bacterium]
MSSSPARTPIELDPADRPRAALAFILGLLAVPGSTVAWEYVPAGGFVIGLPLALGAILLGYRAQRSGAGTWMTITGMALGTICIAFMGAWTVGLIGD